MEQKEGFCGNRAGNFDSPLCSQVKQAGWRETARVQVSPWLLRAEDARLEHLQPQTRRAAPSPEPSRHEGFQRGHLPGDAARVSFTSSLLKQTVKKRNQTNQTKPTLGNRRLCSAWWDWHARQLTVTGKLEVGQEPQYYCSRSVSVTSRWAEGLRKDWGSSVAWHIWRKEPSAPRKTTSPRLAWSDVGFNFTEKAQQIRGENRAIAVTKQQSSFTQQKLGPATTLLILFSTQLPAVSQEYRSKFTRAYKYLF